ncbi:MAG: hypothetical protein BWY66_01374 [bacterium ADurb.Bin374]|nr:MAG: hypothetical protein BWY66_01374 [bacterium ADurb.Bin374]
MPPDRLDRPVVGEGQPAGKLAIETPKPVFPQEATRERVAGHFPHLRTIDRFAVEPGRCGRLQPSQRHPRGRERFGKADRGSLLMRTARPAVAAHDDAARQIRSRREHEAVAGEADARFELHASHPAALDMNGSDVTLPERQTSRGEQRPKHPVAVQFLVGLGAPGPHRRPFRRVQPLELDAGFVDRRGHFPAQDADLTHQMTFSRAADAGIAGHEGHGGKVHRQQQRRNAEPGGGERRLTTGVAGADDDDGIMGRFVHLPMQNRSKIRSSIWRSAVSPVTLPICRTASSISSASISSYIFPMPSFARVTAPRAASSAWRC